MTNLFRKTLLAAALSALIGSTGAYAQGTHLQAEIPFTFHTAGKVLPAGTYLLDESIVNNVFTIRNSDGTSSLMVMAPIPQHYMPKTSKLVFVHTGDDYILSEISVAGSTHTHAIMPSAIEKNATRKLGISALISVPLHAK